MAINLENIISNFKQVVSPAVSAQKRTEEQLGSFNDIPGMILKYKKLIILFEKTGQTDKIHHLKQQIAKLNKIEDYIRAERQNQINEHSLKIKNETAQYLQTLNEQLKISKKILGDFFIHYRKDFELLLKQLEARLTELQKLLSDAISQLREINKQILDIKIRISDIDKKYQATEQKIEYATTTLERDLTKELQKHNIHLKLDLKKIIQDCVNDKNNPPKDSDDLKSRVMLQMHEHIEQYKKQQSELLNKGLIQNDAEQNRIRKEIKDLENAELDIRLNIMENPNIHNILKGAEVLRQLELEKQNLQAQEQQLKNQENNTLQIAQKLAQEVSQIETEKQELKQEIEEPNPENTPTPRFR